MKKVGSRSSKLGTGTGARVGLSLGRSLSGVAALMVLFIFLLGGVSACGEDIEMPGEISIPDIPPVAEDTPDDGD